MLDHDLDVGRLPLMSDRLPRPGAPRGALMGRTLTANLRRSDSKNQLEETRSEPMAFVQRSPWADGLGGWSPRPRSILGRVSFMQDGCSPVFFM
ncbi:MAG: hypothetical protein JXJ30_07165 [Halothiobacillaceae bacterium]|nr:hypothetical protein [Halothiobacillaceae bacterium]